MWRRPAEDEDNPSPDCEYSSKHWVEAPSELSHRTVEPGVPPFGLWSMLWRTLIQPYSLALRYVYLKVFTEKEVEAVF